MSAREIVVLPKEVDDEVVLNRANHKTAHKCCVNDTKTRLQQWPKTGGILVTITHDLVMVFKTATKP